MGTLPATQTLNLSIVLEPRNTAELASLLSRLYDPESPDYRHFLSVAEFTEQFGPSAEDYQAVVDFALANGFTVTGTAANRMLVPIRGTVAQIEKAFDIAMKVYRHPTEKREFFSPDREPLLDLSVAVAHIAGLNNYSLPRSNAIKPASGRALAMTAAVGSGPGGAYLSSDMRAAYYGGSELTGRGQTVGLVQFDGYNICDVTAAFDGTATATTNGKNYVLTYRPTAGGGPYTIAINNVLLDGTDGTPASGDDGEEVLDIVQAVGMAPGLSQVRVYIGNWDADILNAMAAENIAKQLSISWTWCPDDPAIDDVFFEEFAAQGQSVFVASGDYGAFSPAPPYYYPAEDDWVTAVGGTSLTTNGAGGAWVSETAWSRSGGGISPDGLPAPSWQAGVANASNAGSATLRNMPDVAMEADFDNYDCDMGQCGGGWAGTSFASPRWAGFMALVNQQAASAGAATAGFINPQIYAIGEGASYNSDFHDIASGNNDYDGAPFFYSVTGYDLVTGWGSPDGQNLIGALALPAPAGFQLAALPSILTVNPGFSGAITVSVLDVSGFTGSVNLTVSGLPNGVTASWGTNPATAASLLSLTVSDTVPVGSYVVTIAGASGSATATTTFALAIIAPLGASPASLVYPSQLTGTQSFSQTVTLTNNEPVALTVTGIAATGDFAQTNTCIGQGAGSGSLPPGGQCTVSVTFNPPASGSRSGQLVLSDPAVPSPPVVPLSGSGSGLVPGEFVGIQAAAVGRGLGSATLLQSGKVLLAGGSVTTTLAELYNPISGLFTPAGNLNALRFGHTATLLPNGKVLLAGGLTAYFYYQGQDPFNSSAELYDPVAGTFTATGSMNHERVFHTATLLPTGKVLIAGGDNLTGALSSAELYDPSTGVFTVIGNMATARTMHDATLLNDGTVLVDGGCGWNCPISAELYNPQSGQFSATGNMLYPPATQSTATLLSNGQVLVVAEFYNTSSMSQIYDPPTKTFSLTGPSAACGLEIYHAASPVSGGMVLVTGTFNSGDGPGDGSELYDAQSGSFSLGADMTRVRSGHTATALGNGEVLIVGGDQTGCIYFGNLCQPVYGPSAEVYVAQSVATPMFSPPTGTYTSAQNVTLTATAGAAIYYTTDGTTPTASSTLYTGPIAVSVIETIAAIAVLNGATSAVGTASYNVGLPATPVFSPAGGSYASAQSVTITDLTAGAAIYYYISGKPAVYTGAIQVAASETIQAVAVVNGTTDSQWATAAYVINSITATPVFSPPAGTYASKQSVAISDATSGATIYYTTNGTTPTASSTKYTGAISVPSTETLAAIAIAACCSNSAVASAQYGIGAAAATPTFKPAGGSYSTPQSVTISDATAGATIYYTTDGTTPTSSSTKYTGAIAVSSTETIEAIALAAGHSYSSVTTAAYSIPPPAATPTFTPGTGTYTSKPSVTISDGTAGAIIYYTTNGSTPTTGSTKYTGAIAVSSTEALKAIAAATGYISSAVSAATYTIPPPAAKPTFKPAAGTYTAQQTVSISDTTSGAAIYYTTDGSTPTASSTQYSGAIQVGASETIQAIAVASGESNSAVASAAYTINLPAATPTVSPAAGTYTSAQSVTITDATAGAAIYYTTNGAAPTTSSTKYSGAISVAASKTIKAMATAAGNSNSAVVTAVYTIDLPAATPTFSPAAGTYTAAQKVTISDATAGATIHFTTDGSAPTTSSTKYTGAIAVGAGETIKAVAISSVTSISAVGSAAYIINLPAAKPTFSPPAGVYLTAQSVTIADATGGATIYYTTDGSAPTTSSAQYTGAIQVAATETIQAIAVASGFSQSTTGKAVYTIR